jgi:hypothetical protein
VSGAIASRRFRDRPRSGLDVEAYSEASAETRGQYADLAELVIDAARAA